MSVRRYSCFHRVCVYVCARVCESESEGGPLSTGEEATDHVEGMDR